MNFTLVQAMKATEGEQIYNSTLSLTSIPDSGGWLTPRHATPTLPPGKEPVRNVQEDG